MSISMTRPLAHQTKDKKKRGKMILRCEVQASDLQIWLVIRRDLPNQSDNDDRAKTFLAPPRLGIVLAFLGVLGA